MSNSVKIFVGLLDEGVDVWRPVQAEHLHGDIYRIMDQSYSRDAEKWQFEPGALVVCDLIESNEGQILAATDLADNAT
jgi:hypothetical protein